MYLMILILNHKNLIFSCVRMCKGEPPRRRREARLSFASPYRWPNGPLGINTTRANKSCHVGTAGRGHGAKSTRAKPGPCGPIGPGPVGHLYVAGDRWAFEQLSGEGGNGVDAEHSDEENRVSLGPVPSWSHFVLLLQPGTYGQSLTYGPRFSWAHL